MKMKILFSLLSILLPLSIRAQEAKWQCDPHQYQYDMTAYVVLNVSDAIVTDYANFEVAAFLDEECRGVAEFIAAGDIQVGYLRLYSNKNSGETITFKAYDKASKKLMAITDAEIVFKSNDKQGLPSTPIVLTALYDFDVTVDIASGSGIISEGASVRQGNTFTVSANPAEGYHFAAWLIDGKEVSTETPYSFEPEEDLTISAKFAPNVYKITYYMDDGETVYLEDMVEYLSAISEPASPKKEGYSFDSWNEMLAEQMPAKDLSYTAKFTPNKYKVTFMDRDVVISEATLEFGSQIQKPEDPIWDTHVFISWTPEVSTVPAHDVTFVAAYDVLKCKVTYKVDDVVFEAFEEVEYGKTIPSVSANPFKEGYTFKGWTPAVAESMPAEDVTYTAEFTINQYSMTFVLDNGSENIVKNLDYATGLTAPADPTKTGFTFIGWNPEVPVTVSVGDQTFTAQWERNSYTLKFVSEGETVKETSVLYEAAIEKPADPTKEGFTFKGWTPAVTETMPAENVTYAAEFTINTYTIRYYVGGNLIKEELVEYGSPVVLLDYMPENPEQYTFQGWVGIVYETMPAHDIEYRADIVDCICETSEGRQSEAIWDLNGQQILNKTKNSYKKLRTGVYIQNGRKVFVK